MSNEAKRSYTYKNKPSQILETAEKKKTEEWLEVYKKANKITDTIDLALVVIRNAKI